MSPSTVLPVRRGHTHELHSAGARVATVDIVIPVLNEEATLERTVRQLHENLAGQSTFKGRIVIADNGSTDGTLLVAAMLGATLRGVSVVHLSERGRGGALRQAWLASEADVVAYMDVDLSTDVTHLPALVGLITEHGADVAIGSRLHPDSRVVRGLRREVVSRCYNLLLRTVLRVGFHDAQCGFKAVRGEVARRLLPLVADNAWFFDTELLVRAEENGCAIAELPVAWTDDPDSRVKIVRTAWLDLRGIGRLLREGMRGREVALGQRAFAADASRRSVSSIP